MDPTKLLPAAPETANVIEWIAVVLVSVLILSIFGGIPMLLRAVRTERKETLDAFRTEMAAERGAHAAAVEVLRREHGAANERIHERIDGIDRSLTTLVARGSAA